MQARSEAKAICDQSSQRRAISCGQNTHVGQSMWANADDQSGEVSTMGSSTACRVNRMMQMFCLQPLYLWPAKWLAKGREVVQ